MNKTLQYYYDNASLYSADTISADMSDAQNKFLKKIAIGGKILDVGCGSGRDSKLFTNAGYNITAIDGCKTFCDEVKKNVNCTVMNITFEQINFTDEFDGIWACASLLHVPSSEIKYILKKIIRSAKPGASIYLSFKYGNFEGMRNNRYFTDYTEKSFSKIADSIGLKITEMWTTYDVRPSRNDKWLNVLCCN